MAKRDRKQRASKQQRASERRKRRKGTRESAADTAFGGRPGSGRQPGGAWPETEALAMTLTAAAEATAAGMAQAAQDCAGQLLGPGSPYSGRTVQQAATVSARRLVAAIWRHGWQPEDLHQIVRRRLAAEHVRLLVDVLADEAASYSPTALHPRWTEQLAGIGARVWWAGETPMLAAVVGRHGLQPIAGLTQLIELLGLLLTLPALQQLLPAPGSHHPMARQAASQAVDQRALARVRGLLAKAESTPYPEEAEALSAKAQELMTRHSLQRIVAEASTGHREPVTARRLWLDAPYAGAKSLLAQAVAQSNRCRAVWTEALGFVTVVGDEPDLVAVELLTTSLLVQATRAILTHGSHTTVGGRSRTRSFRQSFLIAYATRIGERLRQASATTTDQVAGSGSGSLLPVLAAHTERVERSYAEMFPGAVERMVTVSNGLGWAAGRAAADLALLDTRGQIPDATRGAAPGGLAAAG